MTMTSSSAAENEHDSANDETWQHHPPPPGIDSILSEVYAFEKSLLDDDDNDSSFRSNMSYLNHGGFGDPYPSTLKFRHFLTELCYRNPSVYHRSIVPNLATRARERACDYLSIHKQRDGFAFTSISTALFHVLASVSFEQGDVILTTDTIYHSLKDTILHMSKVKGLKWIQVKTPHGADSDMIHSEFAQVVQEQIKRGQTIKLAVFDHISSKPTIMYPVKKMCTLCRSLSIPTLVDGAHVPGSIPSDLIRVEDIMATIYCVTFHKWCNTPRGASGGIWVNKLDVENMYSCFIDISRVAVNGGWSHDNDDDNDMYLDASKPGYLTDGLTQGIYDESTREYENILVLPHCLDLVLKHEQSFQQRTARLRADSIAVLCQAWGLSDQEACTWGGVHSVVDDKEDKVALSMLSIPLPTERLLEAAQFQQEGVELKKQLKLLKKHLVPKLWQEYSIEVPVFVWKDEILGVRISFGRHVVLDDVKRLGDAVNQVIKEGFMI